MSFFFIFIEERRRLYELDDEGNDQSVDGDSLRESDGQDHRSLDAGSGFRVAADGVRALGADPPDRKRRDDGADSDSGNRADDFYNFRVHDGYWCSLLCATFI